MERAFSKLLEPLTLEEFQSAYFPNRVFVTHGSPARFPELFGKPELATMADFFASRAADVRLWWQSSERRFQEMRNVASATAASLFHTGGLTVVFDRAHEQLPWLNTLLKGMAAELKTPLKGLSVNGYATPIGAGARMHFDEQEVVVVHVIGKKRWRIAPNRQIQYPTGGYFGPGAAHPEVVQLCADFPAEMPKSAETIDLEPGSVLFLPRGTWHETCALEPSLSLTFTFPSSNWLDLLLPALRWRLVQRVEWRKPAAGLYAERFGAAKRSELARLLEALGRELLESEPEQWLGAALDPMPLPTFAGTTQLCLQRGARIHVDERETPPMLVVMLEGGGELELEIEPGMVMLGQWIAAQTRPFSIEEARRVAGALPEHGLQSLLSLLVEHRALAMPNPGSWR